MPLKRSNDRKVTNSVTKSGNSNIRNAFGLPAAISCPGKTETCKRVCYAAKLERIPTMKGVRDSVSHNWELLKDADFNTQYQLLSEMISEFRVDCERKGADKYFRIHWDGDFFSLQYAYAWAKVIDRNPDIEFWAYTRSFDFIEAFLGLDNLKLYLSVDPDNLGAAKEVRKHYPRVLWAYLANTFADESPIEGKSYKCPENRGSIPLISPQGSACMRCGICPSGRGGVVFSIGKK